MGDPTLTISKDSKYATVMAIARRARQLVKESNKKGVNPWEVSFIKNSHHKAIKLAEEEFEQGLINFTTQKPSTVEEELTDSAEKVSADTQEEPQEETQQEPENEKQDAEG